MTGVADLPPQFWIEAQAVLWPEDVPKDTYLILIEILVLAWATGALRQKLLLSCAQDIESLEYERVSDLIANYQEKGYVFNLAVYLRGWQKDCCLD